LKQNRTKKQCTHKEFLFFVFFTIYLSNKAPNVHAILHPNDANMKYGSIPSIPQYSGDPLVTKSHTMQINANKRFVSGADQINNLFLKKNKLHIIGYNKDKTKIQMPLKFICSPPSGKKNNITIKMGNTKTKNLILLFKINHSYLNNLKISSIVFRFHRISHVH
jgi:hypothetical protein